MPVSSILDAGMDFIETCYTHGHTDLPDNWIFSKKAGTYRQAIWLMSIRTRQLRFRRNHGQDHQNL